MRDYWSEDGDSLVHKPPSTPVAALVLAVIVVVMVSLVFLAVSSWLVGILGALMLWALLGLDYLSSVKRHEFDRQGNVLRRQGVHGLEWVEPLDHFTGVQVIRRRNARGWLQIRVNLRRGEEFRKGTTPECSIAVYPGSSEASQNEAREWGERLARFLNVPLQVEL